jgi:hypothetical protein
MKRHTGFGPCRSAAICVLLAGLTAGCETTGGPVGVVQSALVPPPPVNQNLGFPDRPWTSIDPNDPENPPLYPVPADCLRCHDGTGGATCPDPTTNCQVVSLRHHLILDPNNPRYKPAYSCTCCHTPDPSTGVMSVTFDCRVCHDYTPHHRSTPAKERHCAACHGSLVTNYDDDHYVPTYAKSIVTPEPNCKVFAADGSCAAGGCRTCHVASSAVTPATWNNDSTHHGTGLGQGPFGSPPSPCTPPDPAANPPEQCGWCHSISGSPPTPAIDIRTCETCHGPTSLHAIEYQYDTNKGTAGYGHIGADFDCWGCHGFYDKYDSLPPSLGPTIPTIGTSQPSAVASGASTALVVAGQSFINHVTMPDGTVKTYSPVVVLSKLDSAYNEVGSKIVLTPNTSTDSGIQVTLPPLTVGVFSVRVYKDHLGEKEKMSDMAILTVKTGLSITSACLIDSTTVKVTGAGFGPQPVGFAGYGLFVNGSACVVSSWSDTEIVGTCLDAKKNDDVTVAGISDSGSANLKNNCK